MHPHPGGYLDADGIEGVLSYIAFLYSGFCEQITLPHLSAGLGRTCRAIRIGNGSDSERHGILFLGGLHARELMNPDMLMTFAFRLCYAYAHNRDVTFGGKTYEAGLVRALIDAMDIYIFPLVNPDGRIHVQTLPEAGGDPWWRKNRNPTPGLPCEGIDVNRNFDFLWSSGLGTSSSSCQYELYKGAAPFSEPETLNVRHLLDTRPNIRCLIDVHSHSQKVLIPWGDDLNQTTDPGMNFRNPAYDGLRGNTTDGTVYREYIPATDLEWYQATAQRISEAITTYRGRVYPIIQSGQLYSRGISATSTDYAYSRHFVNPTRHKVHAIALETGLDFHPPYSEAAEVIAEVSAGLMEACLSCLCVVEEAAHVSGLAHVTGPTIDLETLRGIRDEELLTTPAGRRYVYLLQLHSGEVLDLMTKDDNLRREMLDLLAQVAEAVAGPGKQPATIQPEWIDAAERIAEQARSRANPQLQAAIDDLRRDLPHFRSRTLAEGLKLVSQARPQS